MSGNEEKKESGIDFATMMPGIISFMRTETILGFDLSRFAAALQKIFKISEADIAAVDGKAITSTTSQTTTDTDKTALDENADVATMTEEQAMNTVQFTMETLGLVYESIGTDANAVAVQTQIETLLKGLEDGSLAGDDFFTQMNNPDNIITIDSIEEADVLAKAESFANDAPQIQLAKLCSLGVAVSNQTQEIIAQNVNPAEEEVLLAINIIFNEVAQDPSLAENEAAITFITNANNYAEDIQMGRRNVSAEELTAELEKEENATKVTASSKASEIVAEGNQMTGSDAKVAAQVLNMGAKIAEFKAGNTGQ